MFIVNSVTAKLKKLNRLELACLAFYAVTALFLFAFLPLSNYPPHLSFLGITSLITAYSLLAKRGWAPWLVFLLFVSNTVFSLFTLVSVGFSNVLVALSMIGFVVLTWLATIYLLLKRRN